MKIVSNICNMVVLCFLVFLFSCNGGFTIHENDFRDVASFEVPEIDEPIGANSYTASFSVLDCTATHLVEEHENIDYLYISDIADDVTQLTMSLKLDGLVAGDFANVKVTADYTSLTSSSKDLVKRLQFDRYGEMVFEVNTGVTSFDPSSATVVIDLDTIQKPQLGYITFNFESAQSVYDQTKSTQSYTLYINISDDIPAPLAAFSQIVKSGEETSASLVGSKSKGYSATFTNDLSKPASLVTQNMTLKMLNVVQEYPLNIRLIKSTTEGGVVLENTESTDGYFNFMLNFLEEKNKIKITENEYVFEISDPSGYYQGLEEPLQITLNSVRNYPGAPDLIGTFATDGDTSPWTWRIQYRIREKNNSLVKKDAKESTGSNIFSDEYKWEE